MLERILKRFISEECKLVVAALESTYGKSTTNHQDEALMRIRETMYEYGSRMDRVVVRLIEQRHAKQYKKDRRDSDRKRRLEDASTIAAKIIMGDTFEPAAGATIAPPWVINSVAQQRGIAAQQQQYNQLAAMGQMGQMNQMNQMQGWKP